jgi:hypothetical protein
MYVRGYLQGSENGRVVTIDYLITTETFPSDANRVVLTLNAVLMT